MHALCTKGQATATPKAAGACRHLGSSFCLFHGVIFASPGVFGPPKDHAAARLGATPMQLALAWLLQRAPNILLIPGTSSLAHLRENLAAADLKLSQELIAELDAVGQGA
jgi:predicted oxidoreductase